MEENQNWPFIFTGVASITFATLISYGLFIRARHRQNLELIASSFPNVVNFSLNFMENGTLKFRTLFETNIDTLARNPVLAGILSDCRDCCTEERAFFSEPRPKKSWFTKSRCCRRLRIKIWGPQIEWKKASEHLHMAILNELSSRYSQGHFGHGIIGLKIPSTPQPKHTQLDVVSETFCFGLTCEQNKDVRAKKVRVMIVAKDFLRHQVSNSCPEPKLERPGHWVRWRTLLEMKQIMEEEERLRAQGVRRVARVWEVTLSFMVPRLRTTSMLTWQKEGVMTNLEALSKQLRTSSDLISNCTGQGPRGRQRRPLSDSKKYQTSHAELRTSRSTTSEPMGDLVRDSSGEVASGRNTTESGARDSAVAESKNRIWKQSSVISQNIPEEAPSAECSVQAPEAVAASTTAVQQASVETQPQQQEPQKQEEKVCTTIDVADVPAAPATTSAEIVPQASKQEQQPVTPEKEPQPLEEKEKTKEIDANAGSKASAADYDEGVEFEDEEETPKGAGATEYPKGNTTADSETRSTVVDDKPQDPDKGASLPGGVTSDPNFID